MIRACPNCKAKNQLPTDSDPDQLGHSTCASCGNYLFPDNFESETNSSSTAQIGIVYIHKHIKGQNVKVGETKSNSADRLRDYSKTHSLEGFIWHKDYEVPLKARQDIEKRAHNILKSQDFGMSFGSAREIFAGTPERAEAAVERAIAESEVNRIELEKQRLQQIKKNKLAKAKAKYDAQLEVFTENWLREWEASKWVKSKRSSLDAFVAGNSFEKQVKEREGWDYVAAAYGVGFHIVGVVCLYYLILGESPSDNGGSIIFNLSFFLGGFLCLKVKSTITVPDQKALAKKAAMEEEIETSKQTTIATARNDFEKHFTLENFYD